MLLELAQTMGLEPKRTSSSKGGEFHSPCPSCGGTDRFMIWPETERYWCRQCRKSGDTVQFCKDFMGLNFHEACSKVGRQITSLPIEQKQASIYLPPKSWEDKTKMFAQGCHQRLLSDRKALEELKERGLSLDTIKNHLLGWNPITQFPPRESWGLEKKMENEKEKKLFLPSGIVIPTFQDQSLRKIKIRRHDWKEGDKFGKYYILPGSLDCIPVMGDASKKIAVVVEAELDAMLVVQEAGDLCTCIALGGAQKRPDSLLHERLKQMDFIIFALDFDDAGKKEYAFWQSTYLNLYPWPVPDGKSPAEAWKLGHNLKEWIASGIRQIEPGS